jgi:uncharacterized membrane protein YcaP (DUF421 family)
MMNEYLDIVFRSGAVYLFMLLAIRLSGKKELSQLSVTDLVLILLISNAVQNAMVGPNTSLLGGILAAAVLFVINYLLKRISYASPFFSRIIAGEETMLIYKGNVIEENLKRERITLDEIKAVIREHGIDSISHVELAILERDGNISVLSQEIKGQTYHRRSRRALHPKHHKQS